MYSKQIKDWSFDIFIDPDQKMIALSQTEDWMDDQLGGHNLPDEIRDAVNTVITMDESESCEAIWDFTSDLEASVIIEKLINLGFTKQTM